MKVHNLEQRSQDWFEIRLGKLTASRCDKIFKSTAMGLLDEIVAERLTNQVEDNYTSDAMQRGIDLEPMAKEAFTQETGIELIDFGFITHSEHQFIGLSPDGLTADFSIAAEIKCPDSKKHIEYIRTNRIPATYANQCLHYFAVIDELKTLYFVSFDPRVQQKPIHIIEMPRPSNDEIQAYLLSLINFNQKCNDVYESIIF